MQAMFVGMTTAAAVSSGINDIADPNSPRLVFLLLRLSLLLRLVQALDSFVKGWIHHDANVLLVQLGRILVMYLIWVSPGLFL